MSVSLDVEKGTKNWFFHRKLHFSVILGLGCYLWRQWQITMQYPAQQSVDFCNTFSLTVSRIEVWRQSHVGVPVKF